MYQPDTTYDIVQDKVDIRDFEAYQARFVVRPPYQRKTVWSTKKQQALMDSLFRRYYIPRLVLRQVRLGEKRVVREVVDGQQRIVTAQRFFRDELRLPDSLREVDKRLPGLVYSELPEEVREFVDKDLKYDVDLIKGIEDPLNPEHQRVATEIFWRLQQGESLNFMEIAHARLSSRVRNFLVKHADDISFDFEKYQPVDENPKKHRFFRFIERKNDRMQHLALLGRLLLVQREKGPTDIRDSALSELVENTQSVDGIGDETYESEPEAQELLKTLRLFCQVFESDPAADDESGLKEFSIEYFIISAVMLLDHLRKYYAVRTTHYEVLRKFFYSFHARWREHREEDKDIVLFSDSRQQDRSSLEIRDRLARQLFFEFLTEQKVELKTLDTKRLFDEGERIRIYRRDDGRCRECLRQGRTPEEATVSWSDYEADHILAWVKGGATAEWNGQVLCRLHNARKGGR